MVRGILGEDKANRNSVSKERQDPFSNYMQYQVVFVCLTCQYMCYFCRRTSKMQFLMANSGPKTWTRAMNGTIPLSKLDSFPSNMEPHVPFAQVFDLSMAQPVSLVAICMDMECCEWVVEGKNRVMLLYC